MVDNPPVHFSSGETQPIPQLKVLAAWAFRIIEPPEGFDYLSLEAEMGDWYPPPPPPGEMKRLLDRIAKDDLICRPAMSRREKKTNTVKWKKFINEYLDKQSDHGEKLQKAKEKLALCSREPRAVRGLLKAVTSTSSPVIESLETSHEQTLRNNAEILFRGRDKSVKEKRKDRHLIVHPLQQNGRVGVAQVGGANLSQPSLEKVPRYNSMCATVLCYLKNPLTQSMVKIRALLDSGAEVSLVEKFAARRAGISGRDSSLTINVAGGGNSGQPLQEIAFQLMSMDKSYCSPTMLGYASAGVATAFQPVNFNPKHHNYLRDLTLAEKFPNTEARPINMLVGEPYYSMLEEDIVRNPDDPVLPKAVKTKLGWVLRGASKVFKEVPVATVCSNSQADHEIFDLETMQKSMGFDFRKFWTGENVGISPHESMHSDLTALEIRANKFHAETARFDPTKRRWSVLGLKKDLKLTGSPTT